MLVSLCAGQQWRCRHRGQTWGHGMGEAEGGMNGESSMEAHTGPHVSQPARGSLLSDSGAQTGAL